MLNKNIKIFILNRLYDIRKLLKIENIEKNIRCIFHDDRHPSAKIYEDGNAVWCFRCGRFYYVINYIIKFKYDIDELFEELKKEYNVENDEDLLQIYESRMKLDIDLKKFNKVYNKNVINSNNINFIEFSKNYFLNKEN